MRQRERSSAFRPMIEIARLQGISARNAQRNDIETTESGGFRAGGIKCISGLISAVYKNNQSKEKPRLGRRTNTFGSHIGVTLSDSQQIGNWNRVRSIPQRCEGFLGAPFVLVIPPTENSRAERGSSTFDEHTFANDPFVGGSFRSTG